jgi:hypothetical protein
MCQDRDECSSGLHTCGADETCINEVGGYRCEGASSSTIDTDESTENSTEYDNDISEEPDTVQSPSSGSTFSLRSGGSITKIITIIR